MILTATFSLLVAAALGTRLIRKAQDAVALAELRRQAQSIAGEAALVGAQPRQTLRLVRRALGLSGASLYRISPNGITLLGGDADLPPSGSDIRRLIGGETLQGRRNTAAGEVIFVARPVAGRRPILALVLARPAAQGRALPVAPSVLMAAFLAVGVAILISVFLARRIAGPMLQLAAAADDLAKGDFTRRVRIAGEDEIAHVGRAFNKMAEDLQASERRQREFLLSISHELRTPLTAIQGYAEAIEDGTAGGESHAQAAGVIIGESKRLTRLVSDLLDLASLNASRFSVSREPVQVASVLDKVQRNFGPQSLQAGVSLQAEPSMAVVMSDQDRLVQVLSNLVENALRYTPAGGRIVMSCIDDGDWALIQVADTGPGFHRDDLEHAFEGQYLWSRYRGLRDVGTGLGLVITRELVRAMGGDVRAANAPGGGASFTVRLRAQRDEVT